MAVRAPVHRVRPLIAAVLCLLSPVAEAWPVDQVVDVEAGSERFRKVATVGWVEVEDPAVATVEVLQSGELLISGVAPGRTLALLYADGRMAVWRIRVGGRGERPKVVPNPTELPAACGKGALKLERTGESLQLVGSVKDERCRAALRSWLEGDELLARDLGLTFEVSALQAQLGAIDKALTAGGVKGVALKYLGAGLVATGKLSCADHRKLLWTAFRHSVGRVALEDQVEVGDCRPR